MPAFRSVVIPMVASEFDSCHGDLIVRGYFRGCFAVVVVCVLALNYGAIWLFIPMVVLGSVVIPVLTLEPWFCPWQPDVVVNVLALESVVISIPRVALKSRLF